eukprot:TRINITY_DN14235_c0_g1_i7.p5 TRINITY_DN14235_c0_g1~~TRINITY_DN14235_c0_g1_i7.p5  ORF type:complete len:116 (-),score=8.28 TRINITY_DN14235_c0_g1_i7:466-813(-)
MLDAVYYPGILFLNNLFSYENKQPQQQQIIGNFVKGNFSEEGCNSIFIIVMQMKYFLYMWQLQLRLFEIIYVRKTGKEIPKRNVVVRSFIMCIQLVTQFFDFMFNSEVNKKSSGL